MFLLHTWVKYIINEEIAIIYNSSDIGQRHCACFILPPSTLNFPAKIVQTYCQPSYARISTIWVQFSILSFT